MNPYALSRFFTTLGMFLIANQLGELLGNGCFNLPLPDSTEELLCPDMSYTLPARQASMPMRGSYPVGAPDLIIEIASPNDTRPELADKTQTYLRAGVRLIWVVWAKIPDDRCLAPCYAYSGSGDIGGNRYAGWVGCCSRLPASGAGVFPLRRLVKNLTAQTGSIYTPGQR